MTPAAHPVSLLRYAASWWRTEWPQIFSRRITYAQGARFGWRRPVWLALAIVYPMLSCILGALVCLTVGAPLPVVIGISTLCTFLGAVLLLGGTILTTAFSLRQASVLCWLDDTRGQAGAAAVPHGDRIWKAYYVHAHPAGHGLGHEVMDQLTAAADDRGVDLLLDASHPDAARFYVRHGFTPNAPGSMRMTRHADGCPRSEQNV